MYCELIVHKRILIGDCFLIKKFSTRLGSLFSSILASMHDTRRINLQAESKNVAAEFLLVSMWTMTNATVTSSHKGTINSIINKYGTQ